MHVSQNEIHLVMLTEDEIPITHMRKIIRGSWAMEQNKASEPPCHDEILNSRMVQQY
jgi:hypothetical protein